MAEESTTPDLADRVRWFIETTRSADLDAMMNFFAVDAVWDLSPTGMGFYRGREAIRSFFEDWMAPFSGVRIEAEEVRDLGGGVAFALVSQHARVSGASGNVSISGTGGSAS